MKNDRNPYNGFKNDRDRRLALLARDVRIVATAIALAYLGAPEQVVKAVVHVVPWWS